MISRYFVAIVDARPGVPLGVARHGYVSHARHRHDLYDLDGAVGRHEMRMPLQDLCERFLRLRLQDRISAEIVRGRRSTALRDTQALSQRRSEVDDRRGRALTPSHPCIHSSLLLLWRSLHHLLESRRRCLVKNEEFFHGLALSRGASFGSRARPGLRSPATICNGPAKLSAVIDTGHFATLAAHPREAVPLMLCFRPAAVSTPAACIPRSPAIFKGCWVFFALAFFSSTPPSQPGPGSPPPAPAPLPLEGRGPGRHIASSEAGRRWIPLAAHSVRGDLL